VERVWPLVRGQVRRAEPDQEFPSLSVFAYFALATWHGTASCGLSPVPEKTYKELESALSVYDAVRTGRSHSLFKTNRRERDNFFDLIDRWLNSLLGSCPVKVLKEELISVIEPLPVLRADGTVCW